MKYNAPVYFVTGNHDSPMAVQFQLPEVYHVTQPILLAPGLTIVGLSGACDGERLKDGERQTLHGWPYGAEAGWLHSGIIEGKSCVELMPLESPWSYEDAVERKQLNDALAAINDTRGQLVVLSHQGPLGSKTARYKHPGKNSVASTGSAALEVVRRRLCNERRLTAWLHGHTHYPVTRRDENVFCAGTASHGYYMVLEAIQEPNGAWTWTQE